MSPSLHKLIITSFFHVAVLISFEGISQKGYTLVHYTDDNGLPQNSVKSLAADSQGFIWMPTENGLVRFDGLHFYNFDKSLLDIQTNRFLPMQPSLAPYGEAHRQRGGGEGPASRMYAWLDFNLFVRIERGVAKVDTAYFEKTIRNLPFFEDGFYKTTLSVGLPSWVRQVSNPVHHIIGDSYGTGSLYVVDSSLVQFYSGGKKQSQVAFHGKWFNYFLMKQNLFHLNEKGQLQKITGRKIEQIDIGGDLLRDNAYSTQFSGLKIYWNNVSDQAYFYFGKNLYLLEAELNGRMYTRLILEGFDLEKQQVESIYRDPATQNLFLGSLSQGLYVLTKQPFQTLVPPDEVVDNVFYAQAERKDHAIITPNGIVVAKDPLTGRMTFGSLPLLRKINPGDKRSLFYDHSKMLWIKNGAHLYKMDENAENVLLRWDLGNEIKHIYEDKNRVIWIATSTLGIYTLDPSVPGAKPVRRHSSAKATYFVSYGRQVFAGTIDGLYVFETPSGNYKFVELTKGFYIKSVHADDQGNIWMTANAEGLLLYKGNKLHRFPLDRKKYLASPHCIVNDGKGFFWIPTDKGLFRVSISDLKEYVKSPSPLFYQYHSKEEGFRTNEFNGGCQPCAVRFANGDISLPSLVGLVLFRPDEVPLNVPDKAIFLDKVLVNNDIIAISGDTLLLPAAPVQTQFYFSTPYFGNSYNLNLSYALVNPGGKVSQADWIPLPTADFSITFSNLNYGTHHLLVRKINGFGKNNYTIRKIVVIVPPLWYQTLWAKVLALILVLLCIFLYNRFRLRKISEEKAKLEDLVARRTARLNDALKDIEGSKSEMARQIHMLSRLLASMTHDIQSPLNYIKLTSGAIPDMIEKGELEDVSEIGRVISDSSQRMGDLLRGLLDYIKVYVYGNSLQFQEIRLRDLVNNKFEIFRNGIELKGNEFVNEVPEELTILSDEQMLGIMIHNLIDNAVKFTSKGVIKVYTELTEKQQVRLLIINTGTGIGEDIIEFINADQDKMKEMIRPYGRNTGLGLLIVKEIAEVIQVGLHVYQAGSTCFSLTFKKS